MKSRGDEIFELFEGVCPTCEQPTHVIRVGGTKKFQTMQTWLFDLEAVEISWWDEDRMPADENIGSVEFECDFGHKHYTEYTSYGDWT